MSQPYSYLIGIRNNVVYAKNGLTSDIDFCGTDARTVIQSAIDALTKGGRIFIKRGTFTITTPIVVNQHGITIKGEGRDVTILQDGSASGIEVISLELPSGETSLKNLVIEDLSVYGKSQTVSGDLIAFKDAGDLDTPSFRRIKFRYIANGKYGLYLKRPHHALIQECYWITFADGGNGILLLSDTVGETADNIVLFRNNFFTGNNGVTFLHIQRTAGALRRIEAYSNIFWASTTATGTKAIHLDGTMGWMNFIGNNFEDLVHAFYIPGSAENIYIKGNYIFARFPTLPTGQRCIELSSYTRNVQVIGNYFEGYTGVTYLTGIEDKNTSEPANIVEMNRFVDFDRPILLATGATTKLRCNVGFPTENSGVATFSGDGTTKVFNISSHGLALTPTDRTKIKAYGTPQSIDAENASPLSVYPADLDGDGNYEGLKIVFAEAPIAGTDNVKVTWYAEL